MSKWKMKNEKIKYVWNKNCPNEKYPNDKKIERKFPYEIHRSDESYS